MDPSEVSNLFDPYSQASVTTARQYGGTGLGLVISKKMVEMMGGDIRVESQPGKGSDFIFTISTNISDDNPYAPFVEKLQDKKVLVSLLKELLGTFTFFDLHIEDRFDRRILFAIFTINITLHINDNLTP